MYLQQPFNHKPAHIPNAEQLWSTDPKESNQWTFIWELQAIVHQPCFPYNPQTYISQND